MATSFRCRPEMGSDDFSYIRGDLLLIRDGLLRGLNDILNLLVSINTEICKILGTFTPERDLEQHAIIETFPVCNQWWWDTVRKA